MGIFENFLEEIKRCIKEEFSSSLNLNNADCWMNKKELAEYWGVSESWINKNIDNIPHSAMKPISFKKSIVDDWRMGNHNSNTKVSIKTYKKNTFKVG